MSRVRVAGIIPMEDGFAFMYRTGVIKRSDFQDYYTFAGGGLEDGESLEEGVIREIKEEFGIDIKVVRKLYEMQCKKFDQKEYFFLCEYIGGEFGTGTGPEFSNNAKYKDSGKFIPEIVKREEVKNILLLPQEITERFLKDIEDGRI